MPENNVKSISVMGEFYRKLTHLFALVIPGIYYLFNLTPQEMLLILVPFTIIIVLMDISRLKGWWFWKLFRPVVSRMVRDNEKSGNFTGAFYILITSCIVIAVFSKPVAVAAMTFIIIGDPLAVLIGRKYGKHRYGGHRSVEGSLGFLAAALPFGFIAPDLPITVGVVGAFVATLTEGLSGDIDDNATVPLVTGLVMHLMLTTGLY